MTRTKSQAHQLRKPASLGLVHNPGAVDLDRAVADPKLARDLFVREPRNQPVHDLPLPKRQGGKAVWGRIRRWVGARLTACLLQGLPTLIKRAPHSPPLTGTAAANWTPEPTYSGRPRRAGRFHVMAELGHSALPTS